MQPPSHGVAPTTCNHLAPALWRRVGGGGVGAARCSSTMARAGTTGGEAAHIAARLRPLVWRRCVRPAGCAVGNGPKPARRVWREHVVPRRSTCLAAPSARRVRRPCAAPDRFRAEAVRVPSFPATAAVAARAEVCSSAIAAAPTAVRAILRCVQDGCAPPAPLPLHGRPAGLRPPRPVRGRAWRAIHKGVCSLARGCRTEACAPRNRGKALAETALGLPPDAEHPVADGIARRTPTRQAETCASFLHFASPRRWLTSMSGQKRFNVNRGEPAVDADIPGTRRAGRAAH